MKKPTSARISQLLFLALFLVLFVRTEYRGSDEIGAAVNGFFRANPLVLVSYLLAAKSWSWLLLPAAVTLAATALLGRFFCGWICPLGTVLDLVTGRIAKSGAIRALGGNTKYWLLLPLLFASLFGINLAGLLDPIAILLRALTFALYPLLGDISRQGWVGLYRVLGDSRDTIAPAYAVLRDYLLPFRDTLYPLAFLSLLIFGAILFLEKYETRCWCRRLCPLGTLLGLAGRLSPFVRVPAKLCKDCGACAELCPTSFDQEILQKDECIMCMECQLHCPHNRVRFRLTSLAASGGDYLPERRVLLGSLFSGLFVSRLFRFRQPEAQARLLRPPGVRNEQEFLQKCVRCGECLKVCLKSALYPAIMQAGVEGIYTPVVIPRLGYCEYNCTLCGQVCPTGAIPNLPKEQKKREVIGKAVFDKNHCLPFARHTSCIVCEEHCPIPQKAIRSRLETQKTPDGRTVQVQVPYVVEEICNGCGICEFVCPLEGKSGIELFSVKDKKPIADAAVPPSAEPSAAADPYR
ncbi:4Fe-4S binding protein [Geobacter pelophilus]|uniref:4Fe-4S binding protein n=1 Tax=Geoanaerobacter pelophilus TaxID=60036 RepID=A0AAW4L7V6_9BACT|nr:4Fe-4S binding protein [Geoanaerobacter pelophilus]MBT0666242.1 4Fe-4S binding protein [Geoanaerobacter pelophilus]